VHILHPKRTTLEHRLPGADPEFVDFVRFCLTVDPNKRPTAGEALQHRWLTEVTYPADP
jgi:serine/threonine protein kinase